jgi:hypothetical protein
MSLLAALFRRFVQSSAANMAVMFGITAPVVVGSIGLGVETGYWYVKDRGLQTAADTAAYAATVEKRRGGDVSRITVVATREAVEQGFDIDNGTIVVNSPALSGNYRDDRSVEVLLSITVPRLFTGLFLQDDVQISARGVGHFDDAGKACVLALAPEDDDALVFSGNSAVMLDECALMSNSLSDSAVRVSGSSALTVPCIVSAGGVVEGGDIEMTDCTEPVTQAPPAIDPYASLAKPAVSDACQGFPNSSGAAVLLPGRYCGGGNLRGDVTFTPGVYIVDGGSVRINATASLSGTGVTLFFTNNATIDINGSATLTLSAPTTGPYKGMLFWGDSGNTSSVIRFNGNASSSLTGVIYFPSAETEFLGSFSGSNGCMRVTARKVKFSGSTTMNSSCELAGILDVSIPGRVRLVE